MSVTPSAVAALAIVFGAACQDAAATRSDESLLPAVGSKTFAPISVEEVRPRVLSPRSGRVLRSPRKVAGVEQVIAAYCIDAATLDGVTDAIRSQLRAEGWAGVEVMAQEHAEGAWYLVSASSSGLSTSVEIMQTGEPGCDASDQIAVGVTVYRIRGTDSSHLRLR